MLPWPLRKDPPGPWMTLWGGIPHFKLDPLGFLAKTARRYPDLAHFRIALTDFYLVSDPELLKEILITMAPKVHKGPLLQRARRILGDGLLTSEDATHLRHRKLVAPAFHREHIPNYAGAMIEETDKHQSGWQAGQVVDIHAEMQRLTMVITGRLLFGSEVREEAREVSRALDVLVDFDQTWFPWSPVIERLPLPAAWRVRQARERIEATVYRMIAQRRADPDAGTRHDFLSMLLRARDADDPTARLSDEELRDECMTFFLAGHETTGNGLTWTFYLLARHPEIQQKLQAELAQVLGGRLPTIADLGSLPYTNMVLRESWRMYPPVWTVARRPQEPIKLKGYDVKKNSVIIISQWVNQRDPRFFPEPERFDPQRFTAEAREARPKNAYFPFSIGPRQCIGADMAWMESMVTLAIVLQRWSVALADERRVPPLATLTLRPKYPVKLRLAPR